MRDKSRDEAIRFQAIAVERGRQIQELEHELKMQKLEFSIKLLEAANEISRLQHKLEHKL